MRSPFDPHPISLVRAFRASARRTPHKLAVVGEDGSLSYAELMQAAAAAARHERLGAEPRAGVIVAWLGAMISADTNVENRAVATVMDAGNALTFTHRTLALRALNGIVEHAAFGRERAAMALALPLDSARGLVAATICLWLGSTLHLVRPGGGRELVASGRCETAWLGPEDARPGDAPPAPRFRLAIYDGLPDEPLRSALVKWLGAERVSAETGSIASGQLYRHPGLVEEGQAFVGAACA